MSTGYSWEGMQVRATLLGARHVYLSASVVTVSTWGAISSARPLPFTFTWTLTTLSDQQRLLQHWTPPGYVQCS